MSHARKVAPNSFANVVVDHSRGGVIGWKFVRVRSASGKPQVAIYFITPRFSALQSHRRTLDLGQSGFIRGQFDSGLFEKLFLYLGQFELGQFELGGPLPPGPPQCWCVGVCWVCVGCVLGWGVLVCVLVCVGVCWGVLVCVGVCWFKPFLFKPCIA